MKYLKTFEIKKETFEMPDYEFGDEIICINDIVIDSFYDIKKGEKFIVQDIKLFGSNYYVKIYSHKHYFINSWIYSNNFISEKEYINYKLIEY